MRRSDLVRGNENGVRNFRKGQEHRLAVSRLLPVYTDEQTSQRPTACLERAHQPLLRSQEHLRFDELVGAP
jgi:hypothetical protein